MLTATDLTGEETHEKKNPRFLLLVLALFIMAGIGYAAFWWIKKQSTIAPIIEEKELPIEFVPFDGEGIGSPSFFNKIAYELDMDYVLVLDAKI